MTACAHLAPSLLEIVRRPKIVKLNVSKNSWAGKRMCDLQTSQTKGAPDHDGASTKLVHDEPCDNRADESHGGGAEVEGERVIGADAELLKEIDKLAGKAETVGCISTMGNAMKEWTDPLKVCAAQVRQAISVRRRSVPLKQSQYEAPAEIDFSCSLVRTIIAIVSMGSTVDPFFWSLATDPAASSSRPARTRNHGDSGANWMRMSRGIGQIH